MAYGVAGSGSWGWLAERIAAPTFSRHLRRSLRQLKRLIEYEQLRERAAGGARHTRLNRPRGGSQRSPLFLLLQDLLQRPPAETPGPRRV